MDSRCVMADVDTALESDRLDDAPHPRETMRLVGHRAAEQTLLDAYRSGRMHHAWILAGEQGIGKATLAYRLARFILANPDPSAPAVANAWTSRSTPTFRPHTAWRIAPTRICSCSGAG